MAGSRKFTTVKSRAIRLTRLDECGAPVIGARSTIVHLGGFTKVENKWDVEAGATFEQQDAWGDYCVNERDKPRYKGADVTAEFCAVDPDTYELAGGARALAAIADDVAATGVNVGYAIGVDTVPGDFALEAWTKVGGGACSAGGDPVWAYSVWGWLTGATPGDLTLERGTATFPLTARAQGAAAAWAGGPYDDTVVTLQAGEVFAQRLTLVQPPAATVGAVALADPDA